MAKKRLPNCQDHHATNGRIKTNKDIKNPGMMSGFQKHFFISNCDKLFARHHPAPGGPQDSTLL